MSVDYAEKYTNARERVLGMLLDLEWHSRTELERIGGNRYTARLLELRRLGYVIESKNERAEGDGKRYRLLSALRGEPQEKRVKVFLRESDAHRIVNDCVLTVGALRAVADALQSYCANKEKL